MAYRVLLVEDDATLRETVAYNLSRQGYEVLTADNGYDALETARRGQPDLLLLDVMLPGIDGFEVCRLLRREMSLPILMLTARSDEVDRVVGLEMGADDYLTKPFSMRELMARVKALLRRVELIREDLAAERVDAAAEPRAETLAFGDLEIDLSRREVRVGGTAARLKPKEFDLLLFLARNAGVALSRDLILERVWDWTFDGNSRTVDVHVRWLREKVEADPAAPTRIVTVRGIGYRFDG
ncbi:MAG: response regulator transcription factor [Anaerolineae bacterium]|uniref:response regulator transcription factor n=1 Tax=Promineifilum sp. TaxID=2664178 RepID=UPI001D8DF77F|nr:response regulator transcription factor [Anaerolineales bacterium]MCB8934776.1 response regulator transcription factor [Promineifilum sp.]MCO5182066.1 response regulator transcription factor [Promineifilum sp.]MCW5847163.1 response regulator transcription factor [Anaerolineae bacterium]